jgi:glycosyltransferase involved in cell wall biosynthesis
MNGPLVSVVVPVLNGERFLGEAIESIRAQSYRALEILAVDDGSTDGTPELLAALSDVQCIRQENAGPASARNRGVEASRGELVAFLDADDVWIPSKLSLQVEALAADPDLELVFGHAEVFHDLERRDPTQPPRTGRILPARLPSSLLVRRRAFERIGPFDATHEPGEAVEWSSRAERMGIRYRMLEQVVYRRRIHGRNIARLTAEARLAYLGVAREAAARARAGDGSPEEAGE